MAYLGLATGLLLPWMLGVVWLRARWLKPENVNWPTLLGYGYLTGTLVTVLVMRLLDLIGIRFGFLNIGATLLALIVIGMWAGRGTPLPRPNLMADWNELCGWKKAAYAVLLAAIVIRVVGLGLETFWRPLFPWDAWQQWATKARVWYEFGRVVPFVFADAWLAGASQGAFTDFAPHYPAAVPLLQTWSALSLGRWDDALMNLPWFGCAIALGLAFYGQSRGWNVPPLFALAFTYFLISLPMLDTHVALAGYADLFMASFFGMAAIAFFHGCARCSVNQPRPKISGGVIILHVATHEKIIARTFWGLSIKQIQQIGAHAIEYEQGMPLELTRIYSTIRSSHVI